MLSPLQGIQSGFEGSELSRMLRGKKLGSFFPEEESDVGQGTGCTRAVSHHFMSYFHQSSFLFLVSLMFYLKKPKPKQCKIAHMYRMVK